MVKCGVSRLCQYFSFICYAELDFKMFSLDIRVICLLSIWILVLSLEEYCIGHGRIFSYCECDLTLHIWSYMSIYLDAVVYNNVKYQFHLIYRTSCHQIIYKNSFGNVISGIRGIGTLGWSCMFNDVIIKLQYNVSL